MDRLVTRIGNEPAVPTELDMDFAFDLDKRTFDGLQRIFNQLCDLTDILGDDYDLDRLKELVEADREGKCVVLPCKVGESVWEVLDVCNFPGDCHETQTCKGCEYREIFKEKLAFSLYMISRNGKLEPPYYASEKEAEAALEKMKEDK